jgi:hypothetical protein
MQLAYGGARALFEQCLPSPHLPAADSPGEYRGVGVGGMPRY